MRKILFVFGTRPEAIKIAPLIKEGKSHPEHFEVKVCVTAQHREMLDQVLEFFEIVPDYDLNLMKPGQDLYQLTADVLLSMKPILEDFQPDYVFVHGDTTTSSSAALAAFYAGVKVCHVEAGLRTFDKHAPFPEEMNRQITGRLADLHFSPTDVAQKNLLAENVQEDKIFITGNTVIDALMYAEKKVEHFQSEEIEHLKSIVDSSKKLILVTGHRRENFGDGFINISKAILEIAKNPAIQIIYPVHLNPNVQKPVFSMLSGLENVHLITPLSYPAFIWLMKKATIILTDSGGVQEEAPSLGIPVLVMRDTTERSEALNAGTVILVGTEQRKIVDETNSLLSDREKYKRISQIKNPYGDGQASRKIIAHLLNQFE